MRLSILEFFLIQILFYIIVWLLDDYAGSLITVVLAPIFFLIMLVALIAEWIEPSRVPRKFFYYLGTAILAPILVGILFILIFDGNFDWMQI